MTFHDIHPTQYATKDFQITRRQSPISCAANLYFALRQFKIQFSPSASNGNGGGKLKHSPPEPICIICNAGGIEKRHNNFSDASSAGRAGCIIIAKFETHALMQREKENKGERKGKKGKERSAAMMMR
jgi:hypothetical protein